MEERGLEIYMPVDVTFDYFPADPDTGTPGSYEIHSIKRSGKDVDLFDGLDESDISLIIDIIEEIRADRMGDNDQLPLYDEDDIA